MNTPKRWFFVSGLLSFLTIVPGVVLLYLIETSKDAIDSGLGYGPILLLFFSLLAISSIVNFIALVRWSRSKNRKLSVDGEVGFGFVMVELILLAVYSYEIIHALLISSR